jgi:hypothetical protein
MVSAQVPSPRKFVVNVHEGGLEEALARRDPDIAQGPILDDRNFVIELSAPDNPRAAWKRLVDRFGSAAWISPAVVDSTDESHFPTGDVTVRFRRPLSDGDLVKFADANGLELRSRNEFIAKQASFTPRDLRATYLPDLAEQLGREDPVEMVWLNTKSAYKRT